jgi:hypothetical protein
MTPSADAPEFKPQVDFRPEVYGAASGRDSSAELFPCQNEGLNLAVARQPQIGGSRQLSSAQLEIVFQRDLLEIANQRLDPHVPAAGQRQRHATQQ